MVYKMQDIPADIEIPTLEETAKARPRSFALDQPAFNRNRLKAEKLIDSKVLEQLIRAEADAGCSSRRAREI